MSKDTNTYQIPTEQAVPIRTFATTKNEALLELGILEVEYAERKAAIMGRVTQAATTLNALVQATAKDSGLPVDSGRWNFDFKTMSFIRVVSM